MRSSKSGVGPARLRSIPMIQPADTMNACRLLSAFLFVFALRAQTVDVVKVVSKRAERKIELPGEFLPYQSVAVRAKVTGFVERVLVDRGSVVKEGQMLAVLVAPELKSQQIGRA